MSLMLNKIYNSVRLPDSNICIEPNDWFALLKAKINKSFDAESKLCHYIII